MIKKILLAATLFAWLLMPLQSVFAAAEEHGTKVESATTEHGGAHGGATAEHVKPPLLPDPTSRETLLSALWVVIIFAVMLAVLYPTAWKGVLTGLKNREERIRKDIADAEATSAKAQATLREYQTQLATAQAKVAEMISLAIVQGEKLATEIRTKAVQEADDSRQRALRDIQAAKAQAVTEIYQQAAEISTAIASKILQRNINVDDQRELVRRGLEELQTAGNR